MSRLSQFDLVGFDDGTFISRVPVFREEYQKRILEKSLPPEQRGTLAAALTKKLNDVDEEYEKSKPQLENSDNSILSQQTAHDTMVKLWEEKREAARQYTKIQFGKSHPNFYTGPEGVLGISKGGQFTHQEVKSYLIAVQDYLGEPWQVRLPSSEEIEESEQTLWTSESLKNNSLERSLLRIIVERK